MSPSMPALTSAQLIPHRQNNEPGITSLAVSLSHRGLHLLLTSHNKPSVLASCQFPTPLFTWKSQSPASSPSNSFPPLYPSLLHRSLHTPQLYKATQRQSGTFKRPKWLPARISPMPFPEAKQPSWLEALKTSYKTLRGVHERLIKIMGSLWNPSSIP